ncbi:NAD-dependent epimerase/dehydratase family protein [Providencia rettgeri]|uniref:NAD-dependent epimerase/dehydratase family protein n=2 Tax=Providencia TaxID=586 RepID=A0ABY9Z9U9_9GAMM|nr:MULTISPECIES: NAD-dependent epimerase/dehydratase family protein [Providencia]MCL0010481.1 NAD-dependent epimerase/dehydratase family protein [Providencia rettgeri]WNK24225.1 NAD-dependent epimerase/dehydratase family protein [Providencia hangzhouensis]
MKTLISGSTGFIGKAVLQELKNNYRVIIRKHSPELNDHFTIQSFNQNTDWTGAFDDIDSIIHLAAIAHRMKVKTPSADEQKELWSVNVEGTLHFANEAAKAGVKRFVFISSIGVNGNLTHEKPFSPQDPAAPHNEYARSKLVAEQGLIDICAKTGMELVIIRPVLVYGENAPGNFGLLLKLIKKVPMLPFGLTNNSRSYISIKNLAHFIAECTRHPNAAGKIFLVSDGKNLSTKELTTIIGTSLGKNIIQLPVPTLLMKILLSAVGKQGLFTQLYQNLEVDSSNMFDELGWKPPYTIEQTMSYLGNDKK